MIRRCGIRCSSSILGAGGLAGLEAANSLPERLFERAADRHHFADRFHLRAEHGLRAGELLELPARDLDDDVIDRRFKARRSLPA